MSIKYRKNELTQYRISAILRVSRDAELPKTEVVFFASTPGVAPLLEWLDQLPTKVQDKCLVRIERLAELGYELRRPEADLLRDGIYELRVRYGTVNYRILYFWFLVRMCA